MSPEVLKEFGDRLLELFRKEQAVRGNHGCMCSNCKDDMIAAIKKLDDEEIFIVEKRSGF